MNYEREFQSLLDKMKEVHDAKSDDYAVDGDRFSNFRLSELIDVPVWKGIVIRMGDKYSRICEFCKKEEYSVKDESVEDTLLDLANYALLCLQAYRESKRGEAKVAINVKESNVVQYLKSCKGCECDE